MAEELTVRVCFCVNEGRYGTFTGFCCCIRLEDKDFDESVCLECVQSQNPDPEGEEGVPFALAVDGRGGRVVQIGGKSYPIRGYGTWAGSWCWDAAWMTPATVRRLLADCLTDPAWSASMLGDGWNPAKQTPETTGESPPFDFATAAVGSLFAKSLDESEVKA